MTSYTFTIKARFTTPVVRTVRAKDRATAQRKADRLARQYGANTAIFARIGA